MSNNNLSAVQQRKANVNQHVVNILCTTEEPLTCSQIHKQVEAVAGETKWIDVYEACNTFGQPFSTVGRVKYHDVLPEVLEAPEACNEEDGEQLELPLVTSEVHVGEFEGQDLELVIEQPC